MTIRLLQQVTTRNERALPQSLTRDINAKIRQFIDGWNDRAHPFTWTKTPEQILQKANRQPTSEARH